MIEYNFSCFKKRSVDLKQRIEGNCGIDKSVCGK